LVRVPSASNSLLPAMKSSKRRAPSPRFPAT
jgi:hypothetical protein